MFPIKRKPSVDEQSFKFQEVLQTQQENNQCEMLKKLSMSYNFYIQEYEPMFIF